MSDAKGQQHEPSMEEILASIRRIIAEDGDTASPAPAAAEADGVAPAPGPVAAPAPAPPPAAAPAAAAAAIAPAKPAPPDDILELTEVVEPDGSVVSLNAAPPQREPPPISAPQRVPEFTPVTVPNERVAPAAPVGERIVSAATAAASVAAFSQIASLSAGRDRDLPLGAGHLTLETLVREELRPILKAWLDQHLPDTVERLVQEEIAQLVRDVQRR
jgi:cell pole-organizing protein PopZ